MTTVEIEINIHGETPSYRQLADQIRLAIVAGVYGRHEPIKSLTTLMQETGLAKGTVQHAIAVLVEEGLVYTVRGRGTFVGPRLAACA